MSSAHQWSHPWAHRARSRLDHHQLVINGRDASHVLRCHPGCVPNPFVEDHAFQRHGSIREGLEECESAPCRTLPYLSCVVN